MDREPLAAVVVAVVLLLVLAEDADGDAENVGGR